MKVQIRLNNLKLVILFVGVIILGACNSGGSSSTSQTQNSNDHLVDPVAKGDGVWDYSVATDYYYGTQNPIESPSLKYDITEAYQTTVFQFVFPVFSTLDAPNGKVPTPVLESYFVTTCPPNEKPSVNQMLNYYALPQLNDSYISTGNILGTCVNGESVTTYYAGFLSHVVPVIEITQNLGAALGNSPTSVVLQVADNVAAVINADPNTYGVAFDNEPLLSKEGTESTMVAGIKLEQTFYGEIAYKLAEQKKYLFLFDAATTAIYLESYGYNHTNLNNIVILQYLYDLDTTSDSQSAGPVSTQTYESLVNYETTKDLESYLSSYPPLRFMLPASSTSTMWEYLQGYNMVATGEGYNAPTRLNNPSTCHTEDAMETGSIDNEALSAFLCSPSNICPGEPGLAAESIILGFLNAQNCVNYTNSAQMIDYFNIGLSSIISANAFANPRYLGSDLYAWRIKGYSDINASKGYYNQYDDPYESSTQLFPSEINPIIWESFINWSESND